MRKFDESWRRMKKGGGPGRAVLILSPHPLALLEGFTRLYPSPLDLITSASLLDKSALPTKLPHRYCELYIDYRCNCSIMLEGPNMHESHLLPSRCYATNSGKFRCLLRSQLWTVSGSYQTGHDASCVDIARYNRSACHLRKVYT